MHPVDKREAFRCSEEIDRQLNSLCDRLGRSKAEFISRPTGKETINGYTKYIFVDKTKADTRRGQESRIKHVVELPTYSVSQDGKVETGNMSYKVLKADSMFPDDREAEVLETYKGVDKKFSEIYAKALKEEAIKSPPPQDAAKLLEVARTIENVTGVRLSSNHFGDTGPVYEQHEIWGKDASLYFRGDDNSGYEKEFARQLSLHLKLLHNAGIVHYDLKPQDVLVKTKNGQLMIKIIDFDIAYNIKKPSRRMRYKCTFEEGFSENDEIMTSFSGRIDWLPYGPYQKVNDMKGYLYTLSKISSDAKIKDCYEKTLDGLKSIYLGAVKANLPTREFFLQRERNFEAETIALKKLYGKGIGEVDNVDLLAKFVYHFDGRFDKALDYYNHFRTKPEFKGQGQPMGEFDQSLIGKINEYTMRLEKAGSLSDQPFNDAIDAIEAKLEQSNVFSSENRKLIKKLFLNLPSQNSHEDPYFFATCCLFALSDEDRKILNEFQGIVFTERAREIFQKASRYLDTHPRFLTSMKALMSDFSINLKDAKFLNNLFKLCDFNSETAKDRYRDIMSNENEDLLKVLIAHGCDITQANNYSKEIKEDSGRNFFTALIKYLKDPVKAKNYYDDYSMDVKTNLLSEIDGDSFNAAGQKRVEDIWVSNLNEQLRASLSKILGKDQAREYLEFMNKDVKTKLLNEIEGESFNVVGQKRLKVIGMSMDIHKNLLNRFSVKRFVQGAEYEKDFLKRREDVKDQLLALHEPKLTQVNLSGLAVDLEKIKMDNLRTFDVKTRLEAVSNKLSPTETQSDIKSSSSSGG